MAKDCPKCGLVNPDTAERCDCGWDFASRRVDLSYARPFDTRILAERGLTLTQVGIRNIKIGATVFVVGIIGAVLIGTVTATATGGYLTIIWYGGILLGAVQFFRGLAQYLRGKKFD